MTTEEFSALIKRRLQETKQSQHRVALEHGLSPDAIRSVLRGHTPKLDRVGDICSALGLEFYIGPPRKLNASATHVAEPTAHFESQKLVATAPPPAWVEEIKREIQGLAGRIEAAEQPGPSAATRQVEVRELAAAAGGGAAVLDETVTGYVSFQRDWLDRHALDPTQCTVINVSGESMEPTLPDGSKILVDLSQRRRRKGCIYVVRTGDGLVVKRASKDNVGAWTLVSDHKDWESTMWGDSEIIGEVRWVGKTL